MEAKRGKEFVHSLVENVVLESDKQTVRHKLFQNTEIIWWNLKQRSIPFGRVGNWYAHFYEQDFECL